VTNDKLKILLQAFKETLKQVSELKSEKSQRKHQPQIIIIKVRFSVFLKEEKMGEHYLQYNNIWQNILSWFIFCCSHSLHAVLLCHFVEHRGAYPIH
jgi:hypothetical protein